MMLPLILLGFAMLTLGFALLCLGEVPFVRGTRIPALRSRLLGGILISFLPVSWGIRALVGLALGTESVGGPLVAWAMFFLYVLLIFAIVFRLLFPKHERRTSMDAAPSIAALDPSEAAGDFDVMEMIDEPAPPRVQPTPPAKRTNPRTAKPKPGESFADDDNPFNFS